MDFRVNNLLNIEGDRGEIKWLGRFKEEIEMSQGTHRARELKQDC